MIHYWDYLMRRKTRLFCVLALFIISSFLSCNLLRHYQPQLATAPTPTYIHVTLADRTGNVLTPAAVVALTASPDVPLLGVLSATDLTLSAAEPPSAASSPASPRSFITLAISLFLSGSLGLYFLYEHYTR